MSSILDYVLGARDVELLERGWSAEDCLVLAGVCYLDLGELAAGTVGIPLRELAPRLDLMEQTGSGLFLQQRALLYLMADTRRFGDMRVSGYVNVIDHELPLQFSAITFDVPGGPVVIAYRGTDNTLTGWREDLHMSFESPVPAQEAAVRYLEEVAARTQGDLVLTGHSKGGNLAAYAAAHASPQVQERILSICSFDGPGLDDATLASPGYARIKPMLHSFIPQGSIVGLLMGHEEDYVIIRSSATGLYQHDLFTWQLQGLDFETLEKTTLSSQLMDETLHNFLENGTPAQRRAFVDGLFQLLAATEAATLHQMSEDKPRAITKILLAALDMDEETRKAFLQTARILLTSGAQSLRDYAAALPRALAEEHLTDEQQRQLQTLLQQALPENVKEKLQKALRSIAGRLTDHHEEGDDHHGA